MVFSTSDIVIHGNLFFEDKDAVIYWDDVENEFVFAIFVDGEYRKILILGATYTLFEHVFNACIINPDPILVVAGNTEPITVEFDGGLDVEVNLTEISINNFPAVQTVEFSQIVDIDLGITELYGSNIPITWSATITETIPVETNITELNFDFPAIMNISVQNTVDVDTGITELSVSNWPTEFQADIANVGAINVFDPTLTEISATNLPATIDISVVTPFDVDLQITEIGISSFPSPITVDIVGQTQPLQVVSNAEPLVTEETLAAFTETFDNNKGVNPYMEQFFPTAKCIFQQNTQSSYTHDFFSYRSILGAGSETQTPHGLLVQLNSGTSGIYRKVGAFHPYNGGRTLTMFSFGQSESDPGISFRIGLLARQTSLYFRFTTNNPTSLLIEATLYGPDTLPHTENIPQTSFNIDTMDGTGPSGFTFLYTFCRQIFWILDHGNSSFTFGVSSGNTLIPVHNLNKTSVTPIATTPVIMEPYVPRFEFFSTPFVVNADTFVMFNGVEMYKDCLPSNLYSNTYSGSVAGIGATNLMILSLQYRDLTYNGNIYPLSLEIVGNRIFLVSIYYENWNTTTPTNPTFGNVKGNADLATTPTAVPVGYNGNFLGSEIIASGTGFIDLEKYVDFRHFSAYNFFLALSKVTILVRSLTSVGGTLTWSLNILQG